jgi:two-component system, NtrC family, response regulator AtoC
MDSDDNMYPSGDEGLALLVMDGGQVRTVPTVPGGALVFGRSHGCDYPLSDLQVSRRHARFEFGERVTVTDLGSSNGTRMLGRRLDANSAMPLALGDSVQLGGTMVVLAHRRAVEQGMRVHGHAHLLRALTLACAGTHESPPPFYLLRLRFAEEHTGVVEEHIEPLIGADDIAASYAPGEYELLLATVEEGAGAARMADVQRKLKAKGIALAIGAAAFPVHGTSAERLIARARPGSPVDPRRNVATAMAMAGFFRRKAERLDSIAAATSPVMLVGEEGVGKELAARVIHQHAARSTKPFAVLDLGAQVAQQALFENNTPASQALAGGTLYVRAPRAWSLAQCAELLALANNPQHDVRLIFGVTAEDVPSGLGSLPAAIGTLLDGRGLLVPPLRARAEEIAPLSRLMTESFAHALGRPVPDLAPAALAALESYAFPGNVRELENVIERAVLLCEDNVITQDDLPGVVDPVSVLRAPAETPAAIPAEEPTMPSLDDADGAPRAPPKSGATMPPPAIGQYRQGLPPDEERAIVMRVLAQCEGNQTHAAKLLGISRRALIARLDVLRVPRKKGS